MHSVRKSLGVQGLQPLVRGHIKPGDNICKRWERKLGKEAGKGSWERKLGKEAGKGSWERKLGKDAGNTRRRRLVLGGAHYFYASILESLEVPIWELPWQE
ncbi:hypothetical protein CgunFtcFv8_007085 [Champsocephalus gunnari]|uniref:Uncharacterized protein n=1 Tax=Champsocephalus gunnari TaxID=52237 RepID=A0AAN8H5W5_CHAGU|nr:hypothetical protein CgunFtcFv8_007085 [Champsocephalus gunnari]